MLVGITRYLSYFCLVRSPLTDRDSKFRACCKRRTGLDWTGPDWTGLDRENADWVRVLQIADWICKTRTGLDWTGKTRTESVFYKSRTKICKTRTESVFYKSRAAICKRRTDFLNALRSLRMNCRSKVLSILMTKFNVFTEKVQCFWWSFMIIWWFSSKLGSGCSTD
jgi:hypothetical protein